MKREKEKNKLINGDKVKMVGAWCNVVQWVNSRVLWVKGVLWSRHLSVCPYICLPVCCSTRCFGARLFLSHSLSPVEPLLHWTFAPQGEE